jgi:hypothetical protein
VIRYYGIILRRFIIPGAKSPFHYTSSVFSMYILRFWDILFVYFYLRNCTRRSAVYSVIVESVTWKVWLIQCRAYRLRHALCIQWEWRKLALYAWIRESIDPFAVDLVLADLNKSRSL